MIRKLFFAFGFFCLGILALLLVFAKRPGLFKTETRYVEIPTNSVISTQPQAQAQADAAVQNNLKEFEEGRIIQFDSMGACAHLETAYGQDPQTIWQMLADNGFELIMGDVSSLGKEVHLDQVCSTKTSDVFHLLSVSSSSLEGDLTVPFSVVLAFKAYTGAWQFFPVTTVTNGLTACRITNLAEKPQTTDVGYAAVSCRGGDAGVSVRDVFVWDKERSEVKKLFSCMAESTPVFYPEQTEFSVYLDDIQEERCTIN